MRALISSLVASGLLAASTASAAAAPAVPAPSRVESPVGTAEQASDTWIWIGAGVVALGTILSIFPGHRRRKPTDPVSAPVAVGAGHE